MRQLENATKSNRSNARLSLGSVPKPGKRNERSTRVYLVFLAVEGAWYVPDAYVIEQE